MTARMKIAMENNPFNCNVDAYGAVFAQLEMQGYTHKEIKKIVNNQLQYVGSTYTFSKRTINHFISAYEVGVLIKTEMSA